MKHIIDVLDNNVVHKTKAAKKRQARPVFSITFHLNHADGLWVREYIRQPDPDAAPALLQYSLQDESNKHQLYDLRGVSDNANIGFELPIRVLKTVLSATGKNDNATLHIPMVNNPVTVSLSFVDKLARTTNDVQLRTLDLKEDEIEPQEAGYPFVSVNMSSKQFADMCNAFKEMKDEDPIEFVIAGHPKRFIMQSVGGLIQESIDNSTERTVMSVIDGKRARIGTSITAATGMADFHRAFQLYFLRKIAHAHLLSDVVRILLYENPEQSAAFIYNGLGKMEYFLQPF